MDKKTNCAEAQMLIRRSPKEVFNAFIDPEKTKHFWFTKGSDNLVVNKEIIWYWEMYNFSAKVIAREIIQNRSITFDWFAYENPTKVHIEFKELNPEATFVSIVHYGFNETGDDLIQSIKDSTGGFTLVLSGLKSYLEHDINLNLIADKYPKELTNHEEDLKNRKNSENP